MSPLIFTDGSPRRITAHAIDRAPIVARTSQAELDLLNQGAGISRIGLVNRLIGRIVSVIVGIVSVIRIGIIIERVPKTPEENKPIVEIAMVMAITIPIAECPGPGHAPREPRPALGETSLDTVGSPTVAKGAGMEGTAAEAAPMKTAAKAAVSLGHRV